MFRNSRAFCNFLRPVYIRIVYPLLQGVLRIHVMAARNLKVGDKSVIGRGSSDPYCVVRGESRLCFSAR